MWIFILAIAAAAQPQATTMQGNGHHANDARRTQEEQSKNQPIHGQEAQPDDRALANGRDLRRIGMLTEP